MAERDETKSDEMKNRTTVERTSDRDVVAKRVINGPARLVFQAWTKPELFKRWWVPKSFTVPLLACEMDVRVGGGYRLAFGTDPASAMEFFGRYVEVVPGLRLVWTNEESDGQGAITTVTFEEVGDRTEVVMHDRYPTKEALDAGAGSMDGLPETFQQLDDLVVGLGSNAD